MKSITSEVGVDVSKDELVVSIDGSKPFLVKNTVQGAEDLRSRLPAGSIVHLEASGGYERTVRRVLGHAGFEVRVHNPLKARRLAQAVGPKAKTDLVDAQTLSTTSRLLPCSPAKSIARQELADLSRTIGVLQETAGDYKRRLKLPEIDGEAAKALKATIQFLKASIVELEKKFVERVKKSEVAQPYELAQSLGSIGPKTARVLVCELPQNVNERTTAQISSYAGLAPIDDSSGKRTGTARTRRGNARLKAALYMPAVCAVRSQDWAKSLYARLRAKGRSHQSAMVAVMRRLLVRVVAVLKRGTPWKDENAKEAT